MIDLEQRFETERIKQRDLVLLVTDNKFNLNTTSRDYVKDKLKVGWRGYRVHMSRQSQLKEANKSFRFSFVQFSKQI